MSCCCIKTLNLCNFPVCGTLEIKQPAIAADSGTYNIYTLVLDYLSTVISLTALQTEGENIKFDISSLNENFQYTGQIFDSNGDKVTVVDNGVTYDCIKFKTIMKLNATATPAEAPPPLVITGTVVVEAVVDRDLVVTGTTNEVTGIASGSNTIVSESFAGVRVIFIRGNVPLPGIDPGDGSQFFTKDLEADFITTSRPLVKDEFIRIQTIPA